LCYLILDLYVGAVTFSVTLALLATSVGVAIIVPVAILVAWLLFVTSTGFGRIERSRARALLDLDIANPHAPLPEGKWYWQRIGARLSSGSRWREIGYNLARLPLAALTTGVPLAAWCGSLALLFLPLYLHALPTKVAHFALFDVSDLGAAIALAVVGAVGVVLAAPWLTLGLANLDAAVARTLLGPKPADQLAAQVTELRASRAAAVDSAEAERRRIERDLHDGAQQRLVSLAMDLGMARERFDDDPESARRLLDEAHGEAKAALVSLRELVRGFQPAILHDRGLDAALSSVIARVPIPVTLSVDVPVRPPAAIESAVYFLVVEALTNVTKHARATRAWVSIVRQGDRLAVEVTDNGVGGADPLQGTGLSGLAERVRSVGGWIKVMSPAGGPTTVMAEIPCAS
jgi:signal transduction histidine kinase